MNSENTNQPEDATFNVVEDMNVNDEQSAEVKGGPFGDGSVRPVRDSITLNQW